MGKSKELTGSKRPSGGGWYFRVREGLIVIFVLLFAVAFNLVYLYPEVAVKVPDLNDSGMHLLLTEMAVEAITQGRDPTDPWQRTMNMGFPLFHYYQHLPHVTVALAHVFTLEVIPLADMMNWSAYLLLSLFPLSIFFSLRLFGFDKLAAAMGGLVASLAATNFLYGFGYTSYVWHGQGLYPQIWAMALLPLALALSYRVLREGRGYFWATLLLAATLMSHLIYGYMAFVTLGVLAFIQPFRLSDPKSVAAPMWRTWRRLIILVLLVVAVTSYFLVPLYLDRQYLNLSVWDNPILYDSYGHSAVLRGLVQGDLFDFGRLSSLTILVFSGLAICLFRWREERYLIPVGIFLLWLMLYFGRATWGPLVNLLPVSRDLHMHRFIAGVHLGGIFLAAIGLAVPWRWAVSRKKLWYFAAPLALTLLILLPAYSERRSYLLQNALGLRESQQSLAAEDRALSGLFEKLDQLSPGRVFAGEKRWGEEYRVGYTALSFLLHGEGLDMMGDIYHRFSLTGDVMRLFDETRWDHYNLFNVRYVVAPEGQEFPDFVRPLQQFGRHRLYQVATTGYFDLVGSDLTLSGGRTDFYPAASSWLASELPTVKQHPVVLLGESSQEIEHALPLSDAMDVIPRVEASAGPSRGTVLSEELGSNFFAADVTVERDSWLLLKATYHPNWRATVDGVQADTVMLMPSFVGVQLTPGEHKVLLEYRPRRLRMILLILGLLTLPLIALAEIRGEALAGWFAKSVLARISNSAKRSGNIRRRKSRRR